jgi:hypothetical protein
MHYSAGLFPADFAEKNSNKYCLLSTINKILPLKHRSAEISVFLCFSGKKYHVCHMQFHPSTFSICMLREPLTRK